MIKNKIIIGLLVLLLIGGLFYYSNQQKRKISVKPSVQNKNITTGFIKQPYPSDPVRIVATIVPIIIPLEIVSPKNNTSVTTNSIIVSGKTSPDIDIMINDYEIKSDSMGKFVQSINLDEGENYISIVVYTNSGVVEKEIIILRELAQ